MARHPTEIEDLVVSAYGAGFSEREVSALTGSSRTAVRRILASAHFPTMRSYFRKGADHPYWVGGPGQRPSDNEDRSAYLRQWHKANREKVYKSSRQWKQENPDRVALHKHRHRARRAGSTIGNPQEIKAREAEIRIESCTWCGSEERIEVDHIWPLAKGGAHAAYNLQALCKSCNSKKKDKILPQLAPAGEQTISEKPKVGEMAAS